MEELDLGRRFDACLLYDALHHSPRADLVFATAHRALKPGGRLLLAEPNWKHRFQGRDASGEYGVTELGYSPRRLKRLLRGAGFTEIRRFHNTRKRLFSNSPGDMAAHVAEPLVYRILAPFWTQIWLPREPVPPDERKQAEIDYPRAIGEEGRAWLRKQAVPEHARRDRPPAARLRPRRPAARAAARHEPLRARLRPRAGSAASRRARESRARATTSRRR